MRSRLDHNRTAVEHSSKEASRWEEQNAVGSNKLFRSSVCDHKENERSEKNGIVRTRNSILSESANGDASGGDASDDCDARRMQCGYVTKCEKRWLL